MKRALGRIGFLALVLFMSSILSSLIIFDASSSPLAIVQQPFESKDFVTSDIGTIIYTEQGAKEYLGNNRWRYRTFIGEKNLWNGNEYVPYTWNDTIKSVDYADMTIEFYDWYIVMKNGTHTLIDDGRWQLYYKNKQDEWRMLDLYAHSWLAPVLNLENMTFGQSYTDGSNQMNISYLFRNCDEVKISASILLVEDMTIQLRWQTSGVLNNPIFLKNENDFTVGAVFQDFNIMWNDAVDFNGINATYDYQAQDRKIDVLFSDIEITANELYLLDPTYDLASDSEDAWADTSPWSLTTTDTSIKMTYDEEGYLRFALSIPQGSSITSAYFYGYETTDFQSGKSVYCYRQAGANAATAPESLSGEPSIDESFYGIITTNGASYHWKQLTITDIVQDQVDEGGWSSGNNMLLSFEGQDSGMLYCFEDYQSSSSHEAYLEIEYTAGGGGESVTIYEVIELSDSSSEAASYHLTINEEIHISESVSVGAIYLIIISEMIGLASFASTSLFAGVGIFEIITLSEVVLPFVGNYIIVFETLPFSEVVSTTLDASVRIFESLPIGDSAISLMAAVVNIFESIPFFDSINIEMNPSIKLIIYEIIEVGVSTIIIGGLEGINIFYDLFFSANSWSYLGPIALVVVGWYLTKKEKFLGILCFIVELLFVSQYLTLVDAHLDYWWHIMILMFGGLFTCVYPMLDRN